MTAVYKNGTDTLLFALGAFQYYLNAPVNDSQRILSVLKPYIIEFTFFHCLQRTVFPFQLLSAVFIDGFHTGKNGNWNAMGTSPL
jgi:hypothetical protein